MSRFQIPYTHLIPRFSIRRASSFINLAFENLHSFSSAYDWASIVFWIVWLGFIALILYSVYLSCRDNRNPRVPGSSSSNIPPRRPSPNSGSGYWFPGDDHQHDNRYDPPPPYPKYQQDTPTWQNWRPGFWTGAALGGLANHWWNGSRTVEEPVRRTVYDWERVQRPSFFGRGSGYRQPTAPSSDYDRGEGSSNLGPMRRSTGLGGSSVR